MSKSAQIKISIPKDEIADFCRRWKISEFALFGSVLRNDFGSESDIDGLPGWRAHTLQAKPSTPSRKTHSVKTP